MTTLSPLAILVDMGTTNTRAWLTAGETIVAEARAVAGVRDTARTGSTRRIEDELRAVCGRLLEGARRRFLTPECLAGAGMLGSSLGLAEVAHVVSPAGVEELAAGTRRLDLPHVSHLPVFIVPGVRTPGDAAALDGDVMRGEETLCVGLLRQRAVSTPALVLNLGSHWKLIAIDLAGRISWSETTLGGELAHAAWRETILAAALPEGLPSGRFDPHWLSEGRRAARELGFARALFGVRLLDTYGHTSADDRLAFFHGAFIEVHLDAWLGRGRIARGMPVTIVGPEALGLAWADVLAQHGVESRCLTSRDAERAFVAGLVEILSHVRRAGSAMPT